MNKETKLFFRAMKMRKKEWKEWGRRQAPLISRLLQKADRFARRGRFREAKQAAWDAMMAINELDKVWVEISAAGNTFIKTVPKGWAKWRRNV